MYFLLEARTVVEVGLARRPPLSRRVTVAFPSGSFGEVRWILRLWRVKLAVDFIQIFRVVRAGSVAAVVAREVHIFIFVAGILQFTLRKRRWFHLPSGLTPERLRSVLSWLWHRALSKAGRRAGPSRIPYVQEWVFYRGF